MVGGVMGAFSEIPNPDPWKHRQSGLTCRTCMWFLPKLFNSSEPKIGRCRRHAPTANGFPAVYPRDWCGDHKIDEGKMP